MPSAADLANALCVVVARGYGRLKILRADEEIVADFDGQQKASACGYASWTAAKDAAAKAANRNTNDKTPPATALRLLLSTTFFKTNRSK